MASSFSFYCTHCGAAEDTLFHNQLVAVKEMSQAGLNLQETLEVTDAFKREAHVWEIQ